MSDVGLSEMDDGVRINGVRSSGYCRLLRRRKVNPAPSFSATMTESERLHKLGVEKTQIHVETT